SFLMGILIIGSFGITINMMVLFALIMAVGMLVDGAIVVVEYADRRIKEGSGPMSAYVEAAKRMFWPIVSSTATTLCAFLPMLFWPGVPGQFMGMLPVTLIFVLSASLVVALIYLPVMGGVAGRMSRSFEGSSQFLIDRLPWLARAALVPVALYAMFVAAMQVLNPHYILPDSVSPVAGSLFGAIFFLLAAVASSITLGAARVEHRARRIDAGYRRTPFGHFIQFISGNPIMPIVSIAAIAAFVVLTFITFGQNNRGVEFFVESEPEQAIIYVRARGNLSLFEKDALVAEVEDVILSIDGVDSAFAFAGSGGLNANTGGASGPRDTVGQVQIELTPWEDRPALAAARDDLTLEELDGDVVLAKLEAELARIPGIQTEILNLSRGPASGKPVHLRLKGDDWAVLQTATNAVRARFEETRGLVDIEDSLPLPGIDWQIDVDVEAAGRYGADVATVGAMVQLVTRGILLDTMRVPSSDDEIEIRVRLPEQDRVLSTLDTLKVRTRDGLVPLSNFISRKPVEKLAQIDRVDQSRYFDVKADVTPGLETDDGTPINPNERIAVLTEWLETERPLPPGVDWEWTGDQEDQAESQAFLQTAFAGALGLMFIILLAQFNSFYNATLVLLAVVLSTTGVLIGMLVMQQPFSIIMTGTGIVALAGIVVNNN
ncbi:MAG: efflux RND transporter permease subunit, partial [Rhodobacteraceae bacterium]|nr:efflux RND transporter permease subunit [Paracoccaceae bacterium]